MNRVVIRGTFWFCGLDDTCMGRDWSGKAVVSTGVKCAGPGRGTRERGSERDGSSSAVGYGQLDCGVVVDVHEGEAECIEIPMRHDTWRGEER